MSPMHHYLYNKLDIILSKTDRFTTFSMRMSACQQSVLKVTSSVSYSGMFECVRLAQHISLKFTTKRCFYVTGSAFY